MASFAGDVRVGFFIQIKNSNSIRSLMQPASGYVIGLLGADIPDAADRVAVDPQQSFSQLTDIEVSISDLAEREASLMKCRTGNRAC